ncbi:MAG TPA: universal stress protein [Nitrospirales bacterium]|nr:universal stress protein [Nitrospirales bacterium]
MGNPLFQKILIPVDFGPCSREAFLVGLQIARSFQSQVILLHVIDTKSLDALNALGLALPSEEKAQKKRLHHHARLLARGLLALPEAKGIKITRLLSEGKPFIEIARLARTEHVDLVIMGSYGGQTGDITRMFFGSTAEKIVRTVNCPVLCIPFPYHKIQAFTDITAVSKSVKSGAKPPRRSTTARART